MSSPPPLLSDAELEQVKEMIYERVCGFAGPEALLCTLLPYHQAVKTASLLRERWTASPLHLVALFDLMAPSFFEPLLPTKKSLAQLLRVRGTCRSRLALLLDAASATQLRQRITALCGWLPEQFDRAFAPLSADLEPDEEPNAYAVLLALLHQQQRRRAPRETSAESALRQQQGGGSSAAIEQAVKTGDYEVQNIIDSRVMGGERQYLLQWKGFSADWNSWEPDTNFHDQALIAEYNRFAASYDENPQPNTPASNGDIHDPIDDEYNAEYNDNHIDNHLDTHDSNTDDDYHDQSNISNDNLDNNLVNNIDNHRVLFENISDHENGADNRGDSDDEYYVPPKRQRRPPVKFGIDEYIPADSAFRPVDGSGTQQEGSGSSQPSNFKMTFIPRPTTASPSPNKCVRCTLRKIPCSSGPRCTQCRLAGKSCHYLSEGSRVDVAEMEHSPHPSSSSSSAPSRSSSSHSPIVRSAPHPAPAAAIAASPRGPELTRLQLFITRAILSAGGSLDVSAMLDLVREKYDDPRLLHPNFDLRRSILSALSRYISTTPLFGRCSPHSTRWRLGPFNPFFKDANSPASPGAPRLPTVQPRPSSSGQPHQYLRPKKRNPPSAQLPTSDPFKIFGVVQKNRQPHAYVIGWVDPPQIFLLDCLSTGLLYPTLLRNYYESKMTEDQESNLDSNVDYQ